MNSLRLKIFFIVLFFASSVCSFANEYVKLQHAGEIGYYAIGVGKRFSPRYSLELFHGVVPKHIGGERLETIAIKNNLHLFSLDYAAVFSNFYFGLNLFHVKGSKYQSSRRATVPDQYYRVGSLRGQIYWGGEFSYHEYLKHGFYFESGINDIVLTNYYNNKDTINPFDYMSLAFGYRYKFR